MKNLKQILLLSGILLVMTTAWMSCTNSNAVTPTSSEPLMLPSAKIEAKSTYLSSLKEAGFSRLPLTVTEEANARRAYYLETTSLNYISTEEMSQIIQKNDLMMANSEFYIGDIPADALKTFDYNFKQYKKSEIYKQAGWWYEGKFYTNEWMNGEGSEHSIVDWILDGGVHVGEILVVGSSDKFDTEAIEAIRRGKDPIIVVSVADGYLELARWE